MDIEMAAEQEREDISYPRDFLRRLAGSRFTNENPPMQFEMEPELSLGLSLGGCFSGQPREMRLVRSSSTATLSIFPNVPSSSSLVRTCSLPVDADEENRKRKEMQSLKRLEAKRKRTEKRCSSRPPIASSGSGDPKEEASRSAVLRRSSSDFDGRTPEVAELEKIFNGST